MSCYKNIDNFGCKTKINYDEPLKFCSLYNRDYLFVNNNVNNDIYGENCQLYMSERCANKWDKHCEITSRDEKLSIKKINNNNNDYGIIKLSAGDILILNTAENKYLYEKDDNCLKKQKIFDNSSLSSPLINYFVKKYKPCCEYIKNPCLNCNFKYFPKSEDLDNDPVMNKILENPHKFWSILVNIYLTGKENNILETLKNTKLYNFFQSHNFQHYIKKLNILV